MTESFHLRTDQLIRFLDGELPDGEFFDVRSHLAACAPCRVRRDQFARLSSGLEGIWASVPVDGSADSKSRLARSLGAANSGAGRKSGHAGRIYFGWSLAAAATLAIGLLVAPLARRATESRAAGTAVAQTALIDINGEDFITLPYSNPDLPMTPRILEMQIPASSLASAGILTEPGMSCTLDRTVRANVLVGMDGQPLGVHVLSSD